MASKEITGHQQQFVEEIDYNEIETEQVVPSTLVDFFSIAPCRTMHCAPQIFRKTPLDARCSAIVMARIRFTLIVLM